MGYGEPALQRVPDRTEEDDMIMLQPEYHKLEVDDYLNHLPGHGSMWYTA